jgi:hypothetical protein
MLGPAMGHGASEQDAMAALGMASLRCVTWSGRPWPWKLRHHRVQPMNSKLLTIVSACWANDRVGFAALLDTAVFEPAGILLAVGAFGVKALLEVQKARADRDSAGWSYVLKVDRAS